MTKYLRLSKITSQFVTWATHQADVPDRYLQSNVRYPVMWFIFSGVWSHNLIHLTSNRQPDTPLATRHMTVSCNMRFAHSGNR